MAPGDFNSAHNLFTFHGALPGGEIWTFGLRNSVVVNSDTADMQLMANFAQDAFQLLVWDVAQYGLGRYNGPGCRFEGVTYRELDQAGKTQNQVESRGSSSAVGVGANAANQLALAVTLRTGLAGRHGRGRIYLPFVGGGIDENGVIVQSQCARFSLQIANLITQLNGDGAAFGESGARPSGFGQIAVQSRTNPGAAAAIITRVSVGNVVDTIRGRRNKLKETYSSTEVVITPGLA